MTSEGIEESNHQISSSAKGALKLIEWYTFSLPQLWIFLIRNLALILICQKIRVRQWGKYNIFNFIFVILSCHFGLVEWMLP